MNKFEEELEKLINQAYDTGYLTACWDDGIDVSNEEYNKKADDLRLAIQQFLEKFKSR